MRQLLVLARRLGGRLYRLGLRRGLLRSDLAGAVDSPRAKPEDIRWIRGRSGRDAPLAEAALLQLVRRGSLNAEERMILRQRATGPTSGIVGWRRGTPAMPAEDGLASLATAAPAQRPAVAWLHWPVDVHNPYQPLVYSRFAERGLVPVRLPSLEAADEVLARLPVGTLAVLHVHWLYWVAAGSASAAEATEKVRLFTQHINELKDRGVRLIWTVHNLLPHETEYPDVELDLRRFMMRRADVVHLMTADQEDLLSRTYGVAPDQVVVAPHPSYVGAYPDWVDRKGARVHLGIPDDLRVLATVGQIRPYKGYRTFLNVLDHAHQRDPGLRWLVAGKVREEKGWREFISDVARHPAVLCFPFFMPAEDLQYLLRAADAAAFPYVRSLNSGALALAASFGQPAYVSADTRVGGLLPEIGYRRFDLADPANVAQVLTEGTSMETPEVRSAVRAHAEGLRPERVSGELADALMKALGL